MLSMQMEKSIKDFCNSSNHKVDYVCLLHNCSDNLLCGTCLGTHNGFHLDHIKSLKDILNFDPNSKIEEVKDIIGTSAHSHKQIHDQFSLLVQDVKKKVDKLIDMIMVPPIINEVKQQAKPYQNLELLSNELKDMKAQYNGIKIPKSILKNELLSVYIQKYNEFQQSADDTIKSIKDSQISSMTYKDLEYRTKILLDSIEEALQSFHKAYFNLSNSKSYNKESEKKKDIENILLNTDFSSALNVNELKKEISLELSSAPSWNSIEYLFDSNILIAGDALGNLKLFEISTWQCTSSLQYHLSTINAIKYHNKTNRFFTASDDKTIKASKLNDSLITVDNIETLTEHTDSVWSLLIVEDHDILYSSGREPCVIGWDLNTLMVKYKFNTHGRGMTGTEMAFIPRLKLLAVSFKDGVINLYNIETPSGEVRSIKVLQKWLHCMCYLESRDELVVGTDIGTIKVWKVGDYVFEPVRQHQIPGGLPTSVAQIDKGNKLLIATGENQLMTLDLNTGERQTSGDFECEKIRYIKVVSQIQRVLISSDESQLLVLKP